MIQQGRQSQGVAGSAKTRNDSQSDGRNQRMAPKRLARVDIGKMDFHDGQIDSRKRIANGDTRVGETAGIDQDPMHGFSFLLDLIDNHAFVIRLAEHDLRTRITGLKRERTINLFEGDRSIDIGLTGTEQIEVRSVNHQHATRIGHAPSPTSAKARMNGLHRACRTPA